MSKDPESLIAKLGERFTYKQEWLEQWENYYCEPAYLHEFAINRPCVLVGSRGSGKTTTLKCLSYESTKKILGDEAENIHAWRYFGLFHRVDTANSRMFSGPELDDKSWQKLFIHHLNLQMVHKLLNLFKNIERDFNLAPNFQQSDFTRAARLLSISKPVSSIADLYHEVEDAILNLIEKVNNVGEITGAVSSPLGEAFSHLATASKTGPLSGIRLFYLLDEYENFTDTQQRIVNTLIKHCAPAYYIKVGVRDYGFRSKLTLADDEYLSHPADYVQISIAKRFPATEYKKFAIAVVASRLEGLEIPNDIEASFEQISLAKEFDLYIKPQSRKDITEEWREINWPDGGRSLLFRAFLLGYLKHKGIPGKDADKYAKATGNSIETAYGTYSFSVVLNELRGLTTPLKKRYSGIETLVDLSGKNIRYFMELILRSFIAQLKSDNELNEISADAQTSSVLEVGETYLRDIETRGLKGKSVQKLISAIGAVFEGLSRNVFSGRPETTQFIVTQEGSTAEEVKKADELLERAVMHGGVLESKFTKAEKAGLVKDKEYRIFPLFCPSFGCSHRKKRRITIQAREIYVMSNDPEAGVNLVMRRMNKGRGEGEEFQNILL